MQWKREKEKEVSASFVTKGEFKENTEEAGDSSAARGGRDKRSSDGVRLMPHSCR